MLSPMQDIGNNAHDECRTLATTWLGLPTMWATMLASVVQHTTQQQQNVLYVVHIYPYQYHMGQVDVFCCGDDRY